MNAASARTAASAAENWGTAGDAGEADLRLRYRLIGVAWASFALSAVKWLVDRVPMPYDPQYRAVIGLMWPTPGLGIGFVQLAFRLLDLLSLGLPLLLVVAVLLQPHVRANPPLLLRRAYELAFALPLLSFVGSGLSRLASNLIYLAEPWVSGVSRDFTPLLTRLEDAALAPLQAALASDSVSWAFNVVYSAMWLASLLVAVPIFLGVGRSRAASHLIVGWILAAVLAIPFFLLFPVFEPWAVNPLYGYGGDAASRVRFLTAGPPLVDLGAIATGLRWATGCCLPSLHITMPALVSRIAYRNGARWIGRGYAAVAGITGVAVIYLGRHWIVDVLAAVPFAWGIAELVARWDPGVVLAWPSVTRRR